MTNAMIMVQWADLTGRGFSPHEEGPAAPREYWGAAERLLQADLSQPPEGIRSTVGHPVWTLRRVLVQGRWLWCFVVQGRRGPFGVAGTCRFAFATEGMTALEAWTAGTEIAAGDQRAPAVPYDAERFQLAVMQLLGGIVTKQPAIPVDGDPAQTATIIQAALKVLPERELRAWSWSTCMLQRPDSPDLRVVSGGWPDDFRREEPHRADGIDQLFRRGPVTEADIKNRLKRTEVLRGFEFLVHYAATGQRPDPELLRGDHPLEEMLVELGHANFVPSWTDVPSMLETPGGRRRLAKEHVLLVKQWALNTPTEAVGWLQEELSGPLEDALLAGAVAAQSGTPDNILDLPTAARPEPTAWHKRLATLLVHAYPQPKQLRAVTYRWIGPSGLLGSFPDRIAARAFLLSLGLTMRDDSEYFPPDPHTVVAELNTHHECTAAVTEEVLRAERPLRFLNSLSERLEPLPGRAVGELLWQSALRDRRTLPEVEMRVLQPLTRNLTRAGLCRQPDEQWIDTMLGTVEQQLGGSRSGRLRRMMYGAVEALLEVDRDGPRSPSLVQRCRTIGYDNHATTQVATALRLAAGATTPATYQSQSWAQGSQNTGSFPIVRTRGRAGQAWRGLTAHLHRGGRRRPFVYLAGIVVAVVLLGMTWVFITHRAESAPPPAAAPAEIINEPPAPPKQRLEIVLPPLQPPSLQRDERAFFTRFDQEVHAGDAPAVVILVSYGGDQNRTRELESVLRGSDRLAQVPVHILTAAEPPPDKLPPGTVIGTVYFNR
jgi:hypothetical protein